MASTSIARLLVASFVALACGCQSFKEVPRPANLDFVLEDMNGAAVRLSDFRGRPMVVNLWATWCVPCQREMPQLVALAEKFSEERLVVIGISTDDGPAEIRAFAKAFSVTYPLLVGRDRSDALVAFEYTGLLPTTVFINAEGMITARLVGRASDAYFERQIRGTR